MAEVFVQRYLFTEGVYTAVYFGADEATAFILVQLFFKTALFAAHDWGFDCDEGVFFFAVCCVYLINDLVNALPCDLFAAFRAVWFAHAGI